MDKTKVVIVGGCGSIGRQIAPLLNKLDRIAVVDMPKHYEITAGPWFDESVLIGPVVKQNQNGPRRKRGKGNKYHR